MAKKVAPVPDDKGATAPVQDRQNLPPIKEKVVEPFYQSGESVFKTREDLDKAFKDSVMMRKDYTQKTQSLSQQWQQLDQRKQELADLQRKQEAEIAEYKLYRDTFNNRPDIKQKLSEYVKQVPSPDVAVERAQGYTDDQLKAYEERIAKLEGDAQEREYQTQLDGIFNDLSGDFPDLDQDAVRKTLQGLGQEENLLPTLARLAAQANKFESAPQAVEAAKVKLTQRGEADLVPPSSREAPAEPDAPVSIEEAAETARQITYESGG